jgi:hypothetical protein
MLPQVIAQMNSNMGHLGRKTRPKELKKKTIVNTLAVTFLTQSSLNLVRMLD